MTIENDVSKSYHMCGNCTDSLRDHASLKCLWGFDYYKPAICIYCGYTVHVGFRKTAFVVNNERYFIHEFCRDEITPVVYAFLAPLSPPHLRTAQTENEYLVEACLNHKDTLKLWLSRR